jgi:hypothetical protein
MKRSMEEVEIFEAKDRPVPYVGQWLVDCPTCGQGMNYSPEEDDAGSFVMDPSEWPVCSECGCMFQPADVCIKVRESDPL